MKRYEELWIDIRDLTNLRNDNSHDYDEKYIKNKLIQMTIYP